MSIAMLTIFAALIFVLGSIGGARPAIADEQDQAGAAADVLFLGDTSFGENYQERLARRGGENILKTEGYDYVIGAFAEMLNNAGFVIANLETPITDLPVSPLRGTKPYIHYADVAETPNALKRHGFDLLSLANNHALDYGVAGLAQTVDLVGEQGIDMCGVGRDIPSAGEPYIHEFGDGDARSRIAIICAFQYLKTYDRDYRFYASEERPGANALSVDRIAAQIKELRSRNKEIFVVVYPHWGRNYRMTTKAQRRLGRALVDAGADLIVGHGAHMFQEVEYYQGRWIVYNLGNFVFASPGRFAKFGVHPYGLIARLMLTSDGNGTDGNRTNPTLRLYPIFSNNRITRYRSRFVTAEEFAEVTTLLADSSRPIGDFAARSGQGKDGYGHYFELPLD